MRYYVFAIQYNKNAQAENRTAPKAFDSLNDAIAEWHRQLSQDRTNATLGWSICMVINSKCGIEKSEKYVEETSAPAEPAAE